jgi:hypothetical protein
MHEYRHTGDFPLILFGLSQCVNAWHYPASGDPSTIPYGATVTVGPGDGVRTLEPYPHPHLAETRPPKPPARRRAGRTEKE